MCKIAFKVEKTGHFCICALKRFTLRFSTSASGLSKCARFIGAHIKFNDNRFQGFHKFKSTREGDVLPGNRQDIPAKAAWCTSTTLLFLTHLTADFGYTYTLSVYCCANMHSTLGRKKLSSANTQKSPTIGSRLCFQ